MALESVTVEFSPQEDRLLLRVQYDGTSEMQFHWTRRLVRLMWPVFVKLAEGAPEIQTQPLPEVRKALVEMKREQALQQVKFIATPQVRPPSGGSGGGAAEGVRAPGNTPVLVTTVQSSRTKKDQILLSMRADQGGSWDLTLSEKLLHALIKLIQDAVARAEWNLDLVLPKPLGAPTAQGPAN